MRESTLLAAVLILLAIPAAATIHDVLQSGTTFVPDNLAISEGDTVRWIWSAGSHTVTSGTGAADPQVGALFDAPLNSSNTIFQYVFGTAGSYPYFCRPHEFLNMKGTITVDVASGVRSPGATIVTLRHGHPNPFGARTSIEYTLRESGPIDLTVYDARGRLVAVLDEGFREAGAHVADWTGTDGNGNRRPAGIYFCRLRAGATVVTRKLVLVR